MLSKDAMMQSFIRKSISLAQDRFKNYTLDEIGTPYFRRSSFERFEKRLQRFLDGDSASRLIISSGLRGVGKTTIIAQLYGDLLEKGVPRTHLLYISMDEVMGMLGCNLSDILGGYEIYLTKNFETLGPEDRIFLFVDEAHYDPDWSLTLKSLFDRTRNVFVIATGSSAISLTTSTDLARRSQLEKVFPLHYLEYGLLKDRILPPSGIEGAIRDALFTSSNAKEAYERLVLKNEEITDYLSKIRPMQLNEYLKYGTLPFAIPIHDEGEICDRIYAMLEKTIFQDLESMGKFNHETQLKIMNLITLLATSDRVNYANLSSALGMSKPTLSECIDALEKTDLIFKIWPHGSSYARIRKTPKYKLMAPAIRTAVLHKIGTWTDTNEMYGSLLEDAIAMYLHRSFVMKDVLNLEFDGGENCADFILTLRDDSEVVIEVGYGNKGTDQVRNSVRHCNPKYGIIVSNEPLSLDRENNILTVPREVFLLS